MTKILNRFQEIRIFASYKEGKVLTAREFSLLLEVAPNLMSRIESGKIPPSKKLALALKKKYGIDPEYFLEGKGTDPFAAEKLAARSESSFLTFESLNQIIQTLKNELAEFKSNSSILESGISSYFSNNIKRFDFYDELGEHLYNVTERSGLSDILLEIQQLKVELAELRAGVAEPEPGATAGGRAGNNSYQNKTAPAIRLTADRTFESTEVILKFPEKPTDLDQDLAARWDRNELALRRWEKTGKSFNAPSWALERFCREVVHFYEGGSLRDVGGILKDFMEEGKK